MADAAGTLTLIEHDLTNSDINVTGIPTVSLQLPIRNLRYLLQQVIDLLFPEIETGEKTDLPNEYDTAYDAPVKLTIGPG